MSNAASFRNSLRQWPRPHGLHHHDTPDGQWEGKYAYQHTGVVAGGDYHEVMRTQFQWLIPAIFLIPLLLPMQVDAANPGEDRYILPLIPHTPFLRRSHDCPEQWPKGIQTCRVGK